MILNFCTNSNHDFYCTCLSVCLVFYYPPDPIRGGPPRAALSGGGLAQTPQCKPTPTRSYDPQAS